MRLVFAISLCFLINLIHASPVESSRSGQWSNPNTWVGGVVPAFGDDVRIRNAHIVLIDLLPTAPDSVIELCHSLTVDRNASLRLGHGIANLTKVFKMTGDLICNGTISAGRIVPPNFSSGEGLIFDYNSSLWLDLSSPNTQVTGTGYLHPQSLYITKGSTAKHLSIDHYNMVLDGDFSVSVADSLNIDITHHSYLNVKGSLGFARGNFGVASSQSIASLTVGGIVLCGNLELFTRNSNKGSSITLSEEGILDAMQINGGASISSAAGGFRLTMNRNSIFRCGKGASSPEALANQDPHLTVVNQGQIKLHYEGRLPSGADVQQAMLPFLQDSCNQPRPIRDAIGASHIAGWYNFTNKPYLLEGIATFKEWGSTNIKTTISPRNGKMYSAYHFNHSWPVFNKLVDVVKHPYSDSLFSDPYFTTHTFWSPAKTNNGLYKEGPDFNHAYFAEQEDQVYETARYILDTYGHLGKTFIFQNWEGDWMLRGSNRQWEDNPSSVPDDIEWQIEGMARMWRAYMRGIERATAEFPNASSEVQYAVEFNKVFRPANGIRRTMMQLGVPCLVADVIPKVRMHLSSWSAYDGNFDEPSTDRAFPVGLWHGLEIAAYYTNDTKGLDGIPVQLGEYGMNENPPFTNLSESQIRDRYDKVVALVSALGVPNVYLWNLHGSGEQSVNLSKGTQYDTAFLYQVLDGKWVKEPDGSWGIAGQLLKDKYFACTPLTNQLPLLPETSFLLYPNPTKGTIYLDVGNKHGQYRLFNLMGQLVHESAYQGTRPYHLPSLEDGVYLIEVDVGDKKPLRKRLIISH